MEFGGSPRILGCTCSDRQLIQVGCDCPAQSGKLIRVEVWPSGYASDNNRSFHVWDRVTDAQIRSEAVQRYGALAVVARIARPAPVIAPPVTEAQARAMTKGDNT